MLTWIIERIISCVCVKYHSRYIFFSVFLLKDHQQCTLSDDLRACTLFVVHHLKNSRLLENNEL